MTKTKAKVEQPEEVPKTADEKIAALEERASLYEKRFKALESAITSVRHDVGIVKEDMISYVARMVRAAVETVKEDVKALTHRTTSIEDQIRTGAMGQWLADLKCDVRDLKKTVTP